VACAMHGACCTLTRNYGDVMPIDSRRKGCILSILLSIALTIVLNVLLRACT
jgi:hypothetical protein